MTIIFSRILPGATATPGQMAIGVALIILANTLVSEALVRRGVQWQSALWEFVAMAVANILIAVLFLILLPTQGGRIDVPATFFFLLLLTLLVTLYDRFRPYYQVRAFKSADRGSATARHADDGQDRSTPVAPG